MTDVFLCQTGQLTNPSKAALRKAGVVVVEVEDPSKCQFIRASEAVSGDDMLWAAMDALKRDFGYANEGRKQREQFTFNVIGLIDAAHSADKGRTPTADDQAAQR